MSNHSYYFADYVASPEPEGGYEPRLPLGASYLQLLEPGRNAEWAIFAVSLPHDFKPIHVDGLREVDEELVWHLSAAEGYPPALALARDELFIDPRTQTMSQDEFSQLAVERIREHFRTQRSSGFFLAEAVADQVGYIRKTGFYWIAGYKPDSNQVKWVSDDYHVYTDSLSCFRISREDVLPLVGPRRSS